jgi:predicted DsbA family dithiol-disulfide isomerase
MRPVGRNGFIIYHSRLKPDRHSPGFALAGSILRLKLPRMVNVTYYLEVISSWCFWAEPAWTELKQRYEDKVQFGWKIAQMPAEAYPASKSQCEWFYRRSGSIVRSPFMLNAGWFEPDIKLYLIPNYVAEAAKDFGVTDDRVRLAIAHAALREGRKVGRWDVVTPIAAEAAGLDSSKLLARAQSPEIAARTQATTAEFHALQVNQRPTFLIENSIGDRALFSGVVRAEPLVAAIEELQADEAAYASWAAHFGTPPVG